MKLHNIDGDINLRSTISILHVINKTLAGRATIGGGALRSLLEGNQPRDIDVFMSSDDTATFEDVRANVLKAVSNLGVSYVNLRSNNGYFTDDFRLSSEDVGLYPDLLLSFIVPTDYRGRKLFGTPEELAKEYDLSPVRLVLLPDNTIYFADGEEEYFKLFNSKQMRVRGDVQSQKRTLKRIEKYEGYGYTLIGEIK